MLIRAGLWPRHCNSIYFLNVSPINANLNEGLAKALGVKILI